MRLRAAVSWAAGMSLRDPQVDLADPRHPLPFPVAVPLRLPLRRAFMPGSSCLLFHFQFHQHLAYHPYALLQKSLSPSNPTLWRYSVHAIVGVVIVRFLSWFGLVTSKKTHDVYFVNSPLHHV